MPGKTVKPDEARRVQASHEPDLREMECRLLHASAVEQGRADERAEAW
jgi:hypothetical protein